MPELQSSQVRQDDGLPIGGFRTDRLFNPRSDIWSDHFEWDEYAIVGKTSIGSATVDALHLNDERRQKIRQWEAQAMTPRDAKIKAAAMRIKAARLGCKLPTRSSKRNSRPPTLDMAALKELEAILGRPLYVTAAKGYRMRAKFNPALVEGYGLFGVKPQAKQSSPLTAFMTHRT